MNVDKFLNKSIAILGYGIEGQSTYKFLTQQGIPSTQITILDRNTNISLPKGISSQLGNNYLDNLETFDIIIRSPGMTDTLLSKQLSDADNRQHIKNKLTSQSQLFFDAYQGRVIGVTGTKGKSTISTLCFLTLQQAGLEVVLAGNVGIPILDQIDRGNQPTYVVYELSSFMLESLDTFQLHIGIFNTIYPTHLEAHNGRNQYLAAKSRLLTHSTYCLIGSQVVDQKDAFTADIKQILSQENTYHLHYGQHGTYTFQQENFYKKELNIMNGTDIQLVGDHNKYNINAIVGVCDILDIDFHHLHDVLIQFSGLPDRIELLGEKHGILWYNDAIATTPQATKAALDALHPEVDTLFFGGIIEQYDFSLLGKYISDLGIANIILFPDSGEVIKQYLTPEKHQIYQTNNMSDAVQRAAKHTKPGKIALLSCGSPSFSLRTSYKQKAQQFKDAIAQL